VDLEEILAPKPWEPKNGSDGTMREREEWKIK
jgi:hypothetical protein